MIESENTQKYFQLGKTLEERYPALDFRNHCYWRIALDNVLQGKWDTMIARPAYRNLNQDQLRKVISLLEIYLEDKQLLFRHNQQSLMYRRNVSKNLIE